MATSLLGLLRRQLFSKSATPDQIRLLIQQGKMTEARHALGKLPSDLAHRHAEALCLEGEILFHERRDTEAEACFRNALRDTPSLSSAHFGLSAVLAETGDLELAMIHAHSAWGGEASGRAAAQLGYCQLRLGNLQAAEMPLRQAVRLEPANATAWNNLGIVLAAKKQRDEASACFARAIALKPELTSAAEHLGQIKDTEAATDDSGGIQAPSLQAKSLALAAEIQDASLTHLIGSQNWTEAVAHCEDLQVEQPDDENIATLLLLLYEASGDIQSGIDALETWLKDHRGERLAHREMGLALARAQEPKQAAAWLSGHCEIHPHDSEAWESLGNMLAKLERYDDAVNAIDMALTQRSGDPVLRAMKAGTLCNACRYDEALLLCEELEREGKQTSSHGPVLAYLGRLEEALSLIEQGLSRQPRDPNLRMFRSQIKLGQEDFEAGWADYAYRSQASHAVVRALPFPLWRGEPLQGKKIIVLAEQGIGDQVMFASCIPDLLALSPAQVVIEALDRVAPTLARSFPACTVIPTGQNLHIDWVKPFADMDYFVPIGDLPRHFRPHRSTFPRHNGYLTPNPESQATWKAKIDAFELARTGSAPRLPRIGFSWKGGTTGTRTVVRTLDPAFVNALQGVIAANWVCLQYGDGDLNRKLLEQAGVQAAYWPEAISDLDQFAALVSQLDLVITVCNSTVHYAGALGVPTWILSPQIPEWRYGIHTTSMPWYPATTIVRQPSAGDWNSVTSQIQEMLRAWSPEG